MKRILSLIMSVLMIATMFCGFAVTSTADATYDACDNLAHLTVEAGEIGEDGTFEVKIWAKDNSPYGWYSFLFGLNWDAEKITPVYTTTSGGWEQGQIELSPLVAYANLMLANRDLGYTQPSISSQYDTVKSGRVVTGYYSVGNYIGLMSAADAVYAYAFGFGTEFFDLWGYDVSSLTMDADKGLLFGTAKFQVVDGATGSTTISVTPDTCNAAIDDASNGAFSLDGKSGQKVTNTAATIDLGCDEPVESFIGLVEDAASIRMTAPTPGMRFYNTFTAEDWSAVTEIGTAIVVAGTTPGTDTTLYIPAVVDADGNFINYDAIEAGATIEFTAVLSNIKAANYDKEFTAYPYYKTEADGTVIGDAAFSCTRSASAVVEAALADSSLDADYLADVAAFKALYVAE